MKIKIAIASKSFKDSFIESGQEYLKKSAPLFNVETTFVTPKSGIDEHALTQNKKI
jgi:hypothetical protein